MADNGKLYPAFDDAFPAEMAKVCAKADIILPNITEACLLTGTEYRTEYDEAYIDGLLHKLLDLGCKTAVITGVSYEPGKAWRYLSGPQRKTLLLFYPPLPPELPRNRRPLCLHGSRRHHERLAPLATSLALAADFVVACIEATASSKAARWYGVEFESQIPELCRMLEERLAASERLDQA